jgi:hypothetical protein
VFSVQLEGVAADGSVGVRCVNHTGEEEVIGAFVDELGAGKANHVGLVKSELSDECYEGNVGDSSYLQTLK